MSTLPLPDNDGILASGMFSSLGLLRSDDLPQCLQMLLDSQSLLTWRFRGRTPDPREIESLLSSPEPNLAVRPLGSRGLLGIVSIHDWTAYSNHAHLSIVTHPIFRGTGAIIEGAILATDHAFSELGLRKLYVEVAGYNYDALGRHLEGVFDLEAVLPEQTYLYGRTWDTYVFGVLPGHLDAIAALRDGAQELATQRLVERHG